MADTRTQLLQSVIDNILTGGRRTIASSVRTVLNLIIGSVPNIADDGNAVGGYPILDGSGKVALSQLPPLGSGITTSTLVITGLTNIDLTGLSGTVILILQSTNPSEIINSFSNFTNVDIIYLCPRNTLDITINNGGGTIRCAGASMPCYGANAGYMQLTKRSNIFYQTQYQDQYV